MAILGDPRTNRHNPNGTPTPDHTAGQLTDRQHNWTRDGIGYWAVEHDGEVYRRPQDPTIVT